MCVIGLSVAAVATLKVSSRINQANGSTYFFSPPYLNVLSVLLVEVAIVFAMHVCLDSYIRITICI
jgi:hypothetical protein